MLSRYILLLVLSPLVALDVTAQTLQREVLKQLQARDWIKRAEAVNQLASHSDWLATTDAKRALLDLLDRENNGGAKRSSGFGATGDEEYAEYYARLLDLVDSFVDPSDAHGVAILVHSIYNPDSRFAVKLASYGEPVVAPLLASSKQRADAYEVLGFVLLAHRRRTSLHPLSVSSAAAVEARLHAGLHDQIATIRHYSIFGVTAAQDFDVLPTLEELARTDPYMSRMGDGRVWYPLRQAAAKAIASLKTNAPSR